MAASYVRVTTFINSNGLKGLLYILFDILPPVCLVLFPQLLLVFATAFGFTKYTNHC